MAFFYGWVIVTVCLVVKIFKCQGQNNLMAYTVPYLLEEFRMSHGQLGMLFSLATLTASGFQPALGRCIDRKGARVCIPLTQLSMCLTLLAFSAAQLLTPLLLYLEMFALFLFLRGTSMGACESFTSTCVSKWFVKRRGRAMSVVTTTTALGNVLAGVVVSKLVHGIGWRWAMRFGGLANLILALPSVLLLRQTPEVCGLCPDGDIAGIPSQGNEEEAPIKETPSSSTCDAEAHIQGEADPNRPLPSKVYILVSFAFFYALIFGGSDFAMVDLVDEAGGLAGGVDVAWDVFGSLSLTSAIAVPVVGELFDRYGRGSELTSMLLCACGVLTCIATNLLCYVDRPFMAVAYGITRGFSSAISQTILSGGLAYAAFGVERDIIGRAMGVHSFGQLAGTGCGPLLYGIWRDLFASFQRAIQISSFPPLLLGACIAAIHAWPLRKAYGSRQKYDPASAVDSPAAKDSSLGCVSVVGNMDCDDCSIEIAEEQTAPLYLKSSSKLEQVTHEDADMAEGA